MIGVFDSGEGGENTVRHLRRLAPRADIALFTDRAHLPYGTKSADELTRLTELGVARLKAAGCARILIACCTASTVHALLSPEARSCSVPIIEPTAKAALCVADGGKIALIATEATVRSREFNRALGDKLVRAIPAGPLVRWIESGSRDGNVCEGLGEYLDEIAMKIAESGADALILGCTHFVSLRQAIELSLMKITKRKILTVDSSESGAVEMLKCYPEARLGEGRLDRI